MYSVSIKKRKDGLPKMKNKLASILAALLLCFSTLPAHALVSFPVNPRAHQAISESEVPDTIDDSKKWESLYAPNTTRFRLVEEPNWPDEEH